MKMILSRSANTRPKRRFGARRSLFTAIALLATCAQVGQALTIDTITGWNGTDHVFWFGETNTATYGQTITVGPQNILKSFTFLVSQGTVQPVSFRAYVMEWDDANSRATGPVLFSSGVMSTTTQNVYETFDVDTGNLALTSGSEYVLFFNNSDIFDTVLDQARFASPAADVYAGGLYVHLNNGDDFSKVTTDSWTREFPAGTSRDLAFRAVFVPEPGTAVMAGLAALGLVGAARRRRQR